MAIPRPCERRSKRAGAGMSWRSPRGSRCWLDPPKLEGPEPETGGRPRLAIRLAKGSPKAQTVAAVIAALPKAQWKRLSIGTGTKGPRVYDWARIRVTESRNGFPGPEVWLLARRSVSDPKELAYYFALAPRTTSLLTLARVAGTRYTVEQVIKEAKAARWGSTATRSVTFTVGIVISRSPCWRRSGWLTNGMRREKKTGLEDLTVPEVRRLLEVALPLPERSVRERLAWSDFRRRKCYRARLCHYQHRWWPKYAGPNPLGSS